MRISAATNKSASMFWVLISDYAGKTLGEGTFSKVKLGKHKITNENVAIKIL